MFAPPASVAAEPAPPASVRGFPASAPNPRFTGAPFARTWLAEDYGASPSSRAVVQNPATGFMYFANAGGLLEFDGTRWRLFPVPGGNGVGLLAVDARGRVWFGAGDEVGYLASDPQGEWRAVSALGQLPPAEAKRFAPGALLARPDGVYCTTHDSVVRFSLDAGGVARAWKFPTGELTSHLWVMDGALHVRAPNGVFGFDGEAFHEVPGLRPFSFVTRADANGGWQMLNRDGVRRWDHNYVAVGPGLPALESPLAGDVALCAAYLPDGRIAFGTTRSGLILADASGRHLQSIDHTHGLLSDRVEGICVDREGGLWAAFRNGIMRLQVDSPYARHGTGLRRIESTPTALALHHGELYLGGGEGLWRRDGAGEFHAIAEVPQYVRGLVSLGDELFVTGQELRRVLVSARAELLGTAHFGLVAVSTTPGVIAHGDNGGLAFERAEGTTWTMVGRCKEISGPTTALCEWPAGVIWAAGNAGVWRVDLRSGIDAPVSVKNYRLAEGVPAAVNQYNAELFAWGGGLAGVLAGRFLRFDDPNGRWIPERRIEGLPVDAGGVVNVWILGSRPAADGSLWVQQRGPAAPVMQIVPHGPDRWRAIAPPGRALTHYFGTGIRLDETARTLWLAGNGMLLSRDIDWRPGAPVPGPVATIRRVEERGGKLVWGDGAPANSPRLKAAQNALRVQFTSPTHVGDYLGRMHTRYRTRLDGLETDWTAWSAEALRDFTNLPYRSFVFHVQAQDDQGAESAVATFAFSIAPPWWLTRWMFAGYGALALTGVAGLVRWRTQALRQRAAQLEAIVTTRTEELRESNVELARLHDIERDEKLAARLDEEKARLEVLRYQLNPHFLYNTLASICGTARTNGEATRMMAQRLADFCRLTLTRADETETIREELRMLQAYLDIEKARWRDSLQIEINVADEVLDERLPTFLLLPLLENAIKHGGRTSPDVLRIRLGIQRAPDGSLLIEVANTGVWDTVTPNPNSTGIGLENLRRRLARHFAGTHTFTIGPEGDWVVARLNLSTVGGALRPDADLATLSSGRKAPPTA